MTSDQTAPGVGHAEEMEPGIRRILAPNASPMTYWGTNTYLIGSDRLVVIDPGPNNDVHLQSIRAAIGSAQVEAILITHSHIDHSPLAPALAKATGAPVMAYGDSLAGRSPEMEELAASGMAGGGEGNDAVFRPDITLKDGETIAVGGTEIQALYTPGHIGNHLSFALGDIVFTGDHVMGWASSLVSPPDGDLRAFMASCDYLSRRNDRIYHAGHGAPIRNPRERLDWLINHRRSRESQILAAVGNTPGTPAEITARVYTDTPAPLLPAAERNVLAHLIALMQDGRVTCEGPLSQTSRFRLP